MSLDRVRVVFMGAPAFAEPSLRALARATDVAAVVTQPDRPRGRGRKPLPTAIKMVAEELELPVHQPERARARDFVATLRETRPDVIAVVAYGQLLPKTILDMPPLGCVNVHPSLLPKYRGAAPIQWALWNGETETGVTIMRLDEGEDTGPILAQRAVEIGPDETAAELTPRLAELGAETLAEVVASLKANPPTETPQDDGAATKAPRLERSMAEVDWRLPVSAIYHRFRALILWPGTVGRFDDGSTVKITECRPSGENVGDAPGVVEWAKDRARTQTGDGSLVITRLQPENRAAMSVADYLNGRRGDPPSRFLIAK